MHCASVEQGSLNYTIFLFFFQSFFFRFFFENKDLDEIMQGIKRVNKMAIDIADVCSPIVCFCFTLFKQINLSSFFFSL